MELIYDPPPDLDYQDVFHIIPSWIVDSITLYNRCVMFKDMQLPDVGGMLDQDEATMNVLAAIHTKVMELKSKKERNEFVNMRSRNTQTGKTSRRRG